MQVLSALGLDDCQVRSGASKAEGGAQEREERAGRTIIKESKGKQSTRGGLSRGYVPSQGLIRMVTDFASSTIVATW